MKDSICWVISKSFRFEPLQKQFLTAACSVRASPQLRLSGLCGRVGSGILYPGLAVKILPSGKETNIKNIFVGSEEVTEAIGGQSVTVTIAGEFDISRGDLIADASAALHCGPVSGDDNLDE